MAPKKILAVAVVLCLAAGFGYKYVSDRAEGDGSLKIYGSVDMRTVSLAFEETGRIDKVLVEEGDSVKAGQTLALLDRERYGIAVDNADAALKYGKRNWICCLQVPDRKKLTLRVPPIVPMRRPQRWPSAFAAARKNSVRQPPSKWLIKLARKRAWRGHKH